MRRLLSLLILPLMALCTMGCESGERFDSSLFTQVLYTPQYASGFEIRATEGGKATLLVCHNPWQGAQDVTQHLLIDPEGMFDITHSHNVQRIEGPARRIVCMSSSYVAMLTAIGKSELTVGVSGIDFISDKYVNDHRDKVRDVGYDNNIDYEMLIALAPDIVLLYGVNAASAMELKLRELGIPYAYIGEYVEPSPLGKAEWVVAIAEIAGCREAGEKFFSEIPARYNHLKELAASATSKPKVMLNTPYADSWYMPSTDSYMARLIDDAAGDYLYDRNTDNTSAIVDNEEAYLMAASADRWINVGQFYSLKELRSRYPKLASIECVKSGNVFNCTRRLSPRGGNDFWESGVIRPDIILSDLIKIFHPELSLPATDESQPEGELYYYTQLE